MDVGSVVSSAAVQHSAVPSSYLSNFRPGAVVFCSLLRHSISSWSAKPFSLSSSSSALSQPMFGPFPSPRAVLTLLPRPFLGWGLDPGLPDTPPPSPPLHPLYEFCEWKDNGESNVESNVDNHFIDKWTNDGSVYVSSLSSQLRLSNQPDRFALSSSQEVPTFHS